MNNVSRVDQLCSVKLAPNVPTVAQNLLVGARLNQFGETWKAFWAGPKVVQILKAGYTLPFPDQTKLDQVTDNNQLLCISPQEPLPVGGIASADKKMQ